MICFTSHYSRALPACIGTLLLLLSGCAGTGPSPDSGDKAPAASAGEQIDPQASKDFEAGIKAMMAGNAKQAEDIFFAMTQAYPDYAGPYINLGILELRKGDHEKAEESLKKALELNDKNPEIYNQLGFLYRDTGRFDEAEQTYAKGLEIDPDYPNLNLNIGILYDLYLNQPERALQYYEHYHRLVPDNKQVELWTADLKQRIAK